MRYFRVIQFIFCVCIINDRLEYLEKSTLKLKSHMNPKSTQYYLAVKNVRAQYTKIWEHHLFVNEYFGTTLLLNTVSVFLTGGYIIYSAISTDSHSVRALTEPFQNLFHIFILYVVCICSCETSDELVNFKQKNCVNLNNFLTLNLKAQKIYRNLSLDFCSESKELAMQINYHQKFIYSACNFFFINYRLLFSVKITFLFFLKQF